MHPHHELIQKFYIAFGQGDSETMAACYHADIVFQDPVFGELRGSQVTEMWNMLCHQAGDIEIIVSKIMANDEQGSAHWTARYNFGKPPRKVFNRIDAQFEFKEGRISKHTDQFSFWRWSRMALGPLGLLLGWQSRVKRKVGEQALRNLAKFTAKNKAE